MSNQICTLCKQYWELKIKIWDKIKDETDTLIKITQKYYNWDLKPKEIYCCILCIFHHPSSISISIKKKKSGLFLKKTIKV